MTRRLISLALVVGFVQLASAADPKQDPALLARFGDTRLRHTGIVNAVAFHPDGKTVAATAEGEPFVRIWDVATGQEVKRYSDPLFRRDMETDRRLQNHAQVVGYAAGGKRLIVCVQQRTVAVFDTDTGAVVASVAVPNAAPQAVAVSRDGKAFAARGDECGELTVWDAASGKELRTLGRLPLYTEDGSHYSYPPEHMVSVVFSSDGKQVAASTSRKGFHTARTDGSGELTFHPVRCDMVQGVCWPVPQHLLVHHERGWESYHPDAIELQATNGWNIAGCYFQTKDVGDGLLVACDRRHRGFRLFDVAKRRFLPTGWLPHDYTRSLDAVAVSADRIAIGIGTGVYFHDRATGKHLPPRDEPAPPPRPWTDLSADAKKRVIRGRGIQDRSFQVWDMKTGRKACTIYTADSRFERLGFSPAGDRVYAFLVSGPVYDGEACQLVVWDADTGRQLSRFPEKPAVRDQAPEPLRLDADGRLWTVVKATGELQLIDLTSGKVARTVTGYEHTRHVAFSPDWKRVAVSGWGAVAVRALDPEAKWQVLRTYPPGAREKQEAHGAWCGTGRENLEQVPYIWFTRDGELAVDQNEFPRREYASTWKSRRLLPCDLAECPPPSWVGNYSRETFDGGRRHVVTIPPRENPKDGSVCVYETATRAEWFRVPLPNAAYATLSADRQRLYVLEIDDTMSVWDWPALEKRHLPVVKVADRWSALASADPKQGMAAVRDIATDKDGIAWLRERFAKPIPDPVPALIAELGHREYAAREAAMKKLIELGYDEAAEQLRAAVAESAVPEVAERAALILPQLHPTDYQVRLRRHELPAVRAVEAAERIGTAEAVGLLREWAKPGDTTLGREAAAAVRRLAGK